VVLAGKDLIMSISRNQKRKFRRRAMFTLFPELKTVYRLIRDGKVPRWTMRKESDGGPAMRRCRTQRGRAWVHPWQLQNTFNLELRRLARERFAANPPKEA
jgi:hypothetical protein